MPPKRKNQNISKNNINNNSPYSSEEFDRNTTTSKENNKSIFAKNDIASPDAKIPSVLCFDEHLDVNRKSFSSQQLPQQQIVAPAPALPRFSLSLASSSDVSHEITNNSADTSQENSKQLGESKSNGNRTPPNHVNEFKSSTATSTMNSPSFPVSTKTRNRSNDGREREGVATIQRTTSGSTNQNSNSNSLNARNNNNNFRSGTPYHNTNLAGDRKSVGSTKPHQQGNSSSSSFLLSQLHNTNSNVNNNNNFSSNSFLQTRKRFGSQYQSIAPPLLDSFIQLPKALYNLWRFFFLAMITLLDRILDLFLLPIRPFVFQRITSRHLVLGAFALVGALSLVLFSNGESPTHAYSAWYHFIQSISALKLYMMSNVLEMAEKLVANVGSDMFESLYADSGLGSEMVVVSTPNTPIVVNNNSNNVNAEANTASCSNGTHRAKFLTREQVKKLRISETSAASSSSSSSSSSAASSVPVYDESPVRSLLLIIGCVVVSSLHSLLLIMQCIVYNVALNGGASLLALLASSNFSELRKVAFKRTAPEELFRYSAADVMENVQLIFIFVVILLRHSLSLGAFGTVATRDMYWILLAEICIDSCKHLIMMRNNSVKDSIYARFEATWFWDVARDVFRPKYLSDCLAALENPGRVFGHSTSSSSSAPSAGNTNTNNNSTGMGTASYSKETLLGATIPSSVSSPKPFKTQHQHRDSATTATPEHSSVVNHHHQHPVPPMAPLNLAAPNSSHTSAASPTLVASQTLPPRFTMADGHSMYLLNNSASPRTQQHHATVSPSFSSTQHQTQQSFVPASFTTTVDESLLLGFPHRRCGLVPIPYVAVLWWICYPVLSSTSPVVIVWILLVLCVFKLVLRAINRGMAARWVLRAKSWGPKRPPVVMMGKDSSNNSGNNYFTSSSSSANSGIEDLPKLEQDLLEKLDRMQQFKTEKEK